MFFHEVSISKAFRQYEDIDAPYELQGKTSGPEIQVMELLNTSIRRKEFSTSADTHGINAVEVRQESGTLNQAKDENLVYSPRDVGLLHSDAGWTSNQNLPSPNSGGAQVNHQPSASLSESGPLQDSREALSFPCPESTSTAVADSLPTPKASPSRLNILKAKRDKIRVGKERLNKLQELEQMEVAVQREIPEENRRNHVKYWGMRARLLGFHRQISLGDLTFDSSPRR